VAALAGELDPDHRRRGDRFDHADLVEQSSR